MITRYKDLIGFQRATDIRELAKQGDDLSELAKRFGYCRSGIAAIIMNRRWPDPNHSPPSKPSEYYDTMLRLLVQLLLKIGLRQTRIGKFINRSQAFVSIIKNKPTKTMTPMPTADISLVMRVRDEANNIVKTGQYTVWDVPGTPNVALLNKKNELQFVRATELRGKIELVYDTLSTASQIDNDE